MFEVIDRISLQDFCNRIFNLEKYVYLLQAIINQLSQYNLLKDVKESNF